MTSSPLAAIPADLIALAHKLADASGEVIRPHFRSGVEITDKDDASPVTVADRGAEAKIRELLNTTVPGHGIIGEEYGNERTEAELVWVIDPIDGTKSFITGRPTFATLIALLHNGVPVMGVINQPISGERWVGAVGQQTTHNGKPVKVMPATSLSRARLGTTGPQYFSASGKAHFDALATSVLFTLYGGDCYSYGQLALGGLDLVVEMGLKVYDYAALVPVVTGAGGIMTDWTGAQLNVGSEGKVVAAASPALHRAALQKLAGG
jgi:histidinol phosphatase-like enzyme (inositol monophosphatase family)